MPRRRPAVDGSGRPRRAVLYRRVSALMGRTGDDLLSPGIQLEAMRRATVGLAEVAVIDDIDVSGTTFTRDGLDRVRAMVEAGQVDAIGVYDVSRLGRNVLESLQFLAWIESHGVVIISACEQVDTSTPAGKLMLTNMLSIAEYRAGEIGASWSRTIANRAARGLHHGKPVGYRRVRGQPLQPDPVTGPVVADAFAAYARGDTMSSIARTVSRRRGLETPTVNIKKWFHSEVYRGHVVAAGEVVVKDAHPALVDDETWEAVQRRLRLDRAAPPRHLAPTWSLVGIAYCPEGHRLQRQPTVYRGEPVDRLNCGRRKSRGPGHPCEGIGGPRLQPVEAEVLRQVVEYIRLLRTDEDARVARLARRAQSGRERLAAERELTRVQSAIARLAKAWALGDVPDSGYHGPMAELRIAERELASQLDGLVAPVVIAPPAVAAKAGERMLRLWPEATIPERSRMLRTVVRRVVVRRAAHWREPEAARVMVEF